MNKLLATLLCLLLVGASRPARAAAPPAIKPPHAITAVIPRGSKIWFYGKLESQPATTVAFYELPKANFKLDIWQPTGKSRLRRVHSVPLYAPTYFPNLGKARNKPFIQVSVGLQWLRPATKQGPIVFMQVEEAGGVNADYHGMDVFLTFPGGFGKSPSIQSFPYYGEMDGGIHNQFKTDAGGNFSIVRETYTQNDVQGRQSTFTPFVWNGRKFIDSTLPPPPPDISFHRGTPPAIVKASLPRGAELLFFETVNTEPPLSLGLIQLPSRKATPHQLRVDLWQRVGQSRLKRVISTTLGADRFAITPGDPRLKYMSGINASLYWVREATHQTRLVRVLWTQGNDFNASTVGTEMLLIYPGSLTNSPTMQLFNTYSELGTSVEYLFDKVDEKGCLQITRSEIQSDSMDDPRNTTTPLFWNGSIFAPDLERAAAQK